MTTRNAMGYYYVSLDDGKQPSQASLPENRNISDSNKLISPHLQHNFHFRPSLL
ncbi:hypothetical protein FOQG_17725 [Fusarium oxysporum f. sp. raphani 54005]|nr:hypothetical protein FOMG_16000 [Fusarium oxysporum f. sp. melonis 26406]EXK77578.1 hypothetical protein FOQG_17725 [Fusarium oxysporum f. sp. raphani 54005]